MLFPFRGIVLSASTGSPKALTGASRCSVSKPLKPWQRTDQPVVEGDIVVPPRALRRGEREMLRFRSSTAFCSQVFKEPIPKMACISARIFA